ncbi:MAG: hypothetical protein FWF10_09190 [Clostridiales bacterium]|nr:hypothetical protein [Clostridiales bacterium]
MKTYDIAGFSVQLVHKYPYTAQLCRDYEIDCAAPDFVLRTNNEEIEAEMALCGRNAGSCEAVVLYRKLCNQLPELNAFVLHAAVAETDGRGLALLGASGAGKSTHMRQWMQYFPDKVRIINGDKPIVRMRDGEFWAYGTPWAGKEHWQRRACAPLAALVFVEQAKENKIRRLSTEELLPRIFSQILLPTSEVSGEKLLEMLDLLVCSIPAYVLHCDISKAAAELSFNTITGGFK